MVDSLKPDCSDALQRKGLQSLLPTTSRTLSPVRFQSKNREIRALFAYFGAKRAKFLCSPDCEAEREGFEPSVRFCRAKPRRVRKLQIAKPYQRIVCQNPASELALGPVSVRYSIDPKRRTQGDPLAEDGHVARVQATRWVRI